MDVTISDYRFSNNMSLTWKEKNKYCYYLQACQPALQGEVAVPQSKNTGFCWSTPQPVINRSIYFLEAMKNSVCKNMKEQSKTVQILLENALLDTPF